MRARRSTPTARASSPASGSSRTRPSQGAAAAIARTSWLHGPPGNDFPEKIARAALRARDAGEPLRVVGDEIGTPTYTPDVADAIVELHLGERAVRRHGHGDDPPPRQRRPRLAGRLGPRGPPGDRASTSTIEEVPASTWQRASTPPLWAVLEPTPLPVGRADARLAARVRGRGPGPEAGARASRLKRRASSCNATATRFRRDRPAVPVCTAAYCPRPHRTRQRQPERANRDPDHPAIGPTLARGEAEHGTDLRPRSILGAPRCPTRHGATCCGSSRSSSPLHCSGSASIGQRRARAWRPPTSPKVAIIVGATRATTASYRTYADEIYAEAIKYTPNVVRVYSPNATWTRVTGGRQRRVDRRVPRTRQRLAEPVHLRSRCSRPRTASGSTRTSTTTASAPTTRRSTTASRRSGR